MVDEILVHEATRQFGEQLQMGVAATLGDKDVDDRVDGSVVERVPLDGRGQAREENGGVLTLALLVCGTATPLPKPVEASASRS